MEVVTPAIALFLRAPRADRVACTVHAVHAVHADRGCRDTTPAVFLS